MVLQPDERAIAKGCALDDATRCSGTYATNSQGQAQGSIAGFRLIGPRSQRKILCMDASKRHRIADQSKRLSTLIGRGLSQLLWPAVCDVCNDAICDADNHLCPKCWNELLTCTAGDYCPRCGRDASKYGLVAGACGACRNEELHFDGIARAGIYADALQRMILAFKHDRSELTAALASLADAALQGSRFGDDIDLFVPVPLHWTRRLRRGYNQSHLLAKRLRHPRARVSTDLVRGRRTTAQPQMPTPAARARNVAGAFIVRNRHGFRGKIICLVDDIKTSGATLNECAKALKEAGAARVYALVLAVASQKSSQAPSHKKPTQARRDNRDPFHLFTSRDEAS
jgi:competence protein ComFC